MSRTPHLYMHTPKAVKRGCPEDRVFLVVGADDKWLFAWKCRLTTAGLIHPGFTKPLPLTAAGLAQGKITLAANGAEPTAEIAPDSLYTKVTLAGLQARIKKVIVESKSQPEVKSPPVTQSNAITTLDTKARALVMRRIRAEMRKLGDDLGISISFGDPRSIASTHFVHTMSVALK